MDFTEDELLIFVIAGGVLILFFLFLSSKKKVEDKETLIKDKDVTVNNVLAVLSSFEYKINPKLKDGYTEKSIQNQLKKHFQQYFYSVVDEYGLQGINATKIDFDIGSNKVGIELKVAKSVFKTSNLHRLSGQLDEYLLSYKNIIVVVFGEEKHKNERAMLDKIENVITKKGAIGVYVPISKKANFVKIKDVNA